MGLRFCLASKAEAKETFDWAKGSGFNWDTSLEALTHALVVGVSSSLQRRTQRCHGGGSLWPLTRKRARGLSWFLHIVRASRHRADFVNRTSEDNGGP